jgi:hypothetical protein
MTAPVRAAWLGALLCCVAGCHGSGPSNPTPPPVSRPPPPAKVEPVAVAEPDVAGDVATPDVSKVSSGSPCEQSCAELHDCVLAQDEGGSAAATSIELGCLAACVPTQPMEREASSTLGSLFGCELPSASARVDPGVDRCASFLACVRAAWPQPQPDPQPSPAVLDQQTGCERACWAYARCTGKDQDAGDHHAIAMCAEQCSAALDDEQERRAGACPELPDCHEIERCVLSLPGA